MCQACVNDGALSQETYDKIESFLKEYPEASWGPAHIVLDDCNVLDGHLQWCLDRCRACIAARSTDSPGSPSLEPKDVDYLKQMDFYSDHSVEELDATAKFLEELLAIPEEDR